MCIIKVKKLQCNTMQGMIFDTKLINLYDERQNLDISIFIISVISFVFLLGKKVIIILDAEVLRPGSEVGQKMGNPIAINADGSVNENDQRNAQQAGKRTGDDQVSGQPASKKPLQQMNNKPSMLQDSSQLFSGRNNTGSPGSSLGTVYPIVSLTPYQNKWTIKVILLNTHIFTQYGFIRLSSVTVIKNSKRRY